MSEVRKMAVIGDKDSILIFKALGLITEEAYDSDTASHCIARLAREGCSVIYITEPLAELIPQTLARYKAELSPALIPIPNNAGTNGLGMAMLSRNMERAVGMNLFVNEEGE